MGAAEPGVYRLFIAIVPPKNVLDALDQEIERLHATVDDAAFRWVRREQQHVTLHFLGDVDSAKLDDLRTAVREGLRGSDAFDLGIVRFGCFDSDHRPIVLWAALEAGDALGRLHENLGNALGPVGFRVESRRFRPHLTIARGKRRVGRAASADVSAQLDSFGSLSVPTCRVDEVELVRSELLPEGPRYTTLERIRVGGE